MRILVAAGASGGHIFPALALVQALKEKRKDIETLVVLPKRSRKVASLPDGCRVQYISTQPIGFRLSLKNFIALFRFLQASLESLFIFLSFKPDATVGFGTLDSIPLILVAWMARTRTLIHEQNCLPGRANMFLAYCADKVAISFPQTRTYLKIDENRIVLTGNPVRQELKKVDRREALNFFGFQDHLMTILVMGGSQGSHRINSCFVSALSEMEEASSLQAVHIAGPADFSELESGYKSSNLRVKLFAFLKEMQYAYSAADLVICRAGATTISELAYFKIPAILIPYPFAYNHQWSNARMLEEEGCARLIKDEALDPVLLRKVLKELVPFSEKLIRMRAGYNHVQSLKADEALAEAVLSLN